MNWRLTAANSPGEAPSFNKANDRRTSIVEANIRRNSMIPPGSVTDPNVNYNNPDASAYPGGPPFSRQRARTNSTINGAGMGENGTNAGVDTNEVQNERAVEVLNRVKEKLTGRDFKTQGGVPLDYIKQTDKLLTEATKLENLCQHYIGWCSFW